MDVDDILYGPLLDYLHPPRCSKDATLLSFAARKSGLGQIGQTPTFHVAGQDPFILLFCLEKAELALRRKSLGSKEELLYRGSDISLVSERATRELRAAGQSWFELSEEKVRDMVWSAIPHRYLAGGFSQ